MSSSITRIFNKRLLSLEDSLQILERKILTSNLWRDFFSRFENPIDPRYRRGFKQSFLVFRSNGVGYFPSSSKLPFASDSTTGVSGHDGGREQDFTRFREISRRLVKIHDRSTGTHLWLSSENGVASNGTYSSGLNATTGRLTAGPRCFRPLRYEATLKPRLMADTLLHFVF